jgi:hypothetical protein
MINPKPADIGRKVVYRDPGGWKVEESVITSFNDTCVYSVWRGQGTRREDLEWLCGKRS